MAEHITPKQFRESDGVDDWRVLARGACTHFRTVSFAAGVALAGAIGRVAEAAGHHPDVDLRGTGVTVRVFTLDAAGVSQRDLMLAQTISKVARELGVPADPSAVQDLDLAIDALDIPRVRAFWSAVLGYEEVGDEDVLDPHARWPGIWFQQMDAPRPQRNRIHVDVFVPYDRAEARIAAALAAGGRLVSDNHAPTWWTLADPEGNEIDVATTLGRD
jgi:4a-hydroxytetrahydrobiopterin dehydratase